MKTQHGRDLTGEEMAEMIEEFCNSFNSMQLDVCADKIVHNVHRTLQQKIMGLFIKCIERWSVSNFDARNEATVKLAKKIVEATGDSYDRALPYI